MTDSRKIHVAARSYLMCKTVCQKRSGFVKNQTAWTNAGCATLMLEGDATKKPSVLALLPGSKEVIKDITDKMGAGMAEYVWG